jgi:phenylacetate-CoA ligase
MKLDDPALDSIPTERRDAFLLEALRRQIAFMRANVPFWHERLATAGLDENRIDTMGDLARFPILSKEELRNIRPGVLLPADHLADMQVCRWTSGTTGHPTVNFWTESDWAALVASTARMLLRQAPIDRPTVFNGYSQGHLTGPLYHSALRRLGAVVYDRSHHPEEQFSTLTQMELFDFNTLVLPERTKRGKGVGLVDLLDDDPNFLDGKGVRWWIGSSGTFAAQSSAFAREQGVEAVSNLYGASEFGLFAISCLTIPGDYHIAQGHVLVEVVDRSGVPVQSGRSGRIVVTHLSGIDNSGNAQAHCGTQILRLAGGDAATLLTDPCECGLTAPRLRDVHRVATAD